MAAFSSDGMLLSIEVEARHLPAPTKVSLTLVLPFE